MNLLLADVRALAGLPRTAAGRRVLAASGGGLLLLGLLSWWFANALLDQPGLVVALHDASDGRSQAALFGHALTACPMVAAWLGLALAQRTLFEAPELPLWRLAPLPPWRPALQALLRAGFTATLWALAIAGPGIVAVLRRGPAPAWAYALTPLAVVAATLPTLAASLAAQLLIVRYLAGRWLRLLLVLFAAAGSIGFSTWLMLALFGKPQDHARDVLALAAADRPPPWSAGPAADLLAAAAGGRLDLRALRDVALWLLATVVGFRLVGRAHPAACERHLAAEPPAWRRRGGRWPAGLAANVLRNEFAQVAQQPGALVGFLVFAVLVFAMCQRRVLVAGVLASPSLPADVACFAALLAWWFLAVLLVLYAHMGRIAQWDGPQWTLWQCAPAAPGAILRGKMLAVMALLGWPLLLVAAAGVAVLDARADVVLAYAVTALGGSGMALGVLTIVGTVPALVRHDGDGGSLQGGKGLVAALLLVVGMQVAALPALYAWHLLGEHVAVHGLTTAEAWRLAPPVVATAIAYGAVWLVVGWIVGSWNFTRLLRPR
ncbi:MAG: hypothetical protein ACK5AL_03675 [Planctomycetota bacterium]